ncbi:MAG: hypothetical protein HKN32_06395, partial [Flavobacteriales bacterium]|nr:hypothetical protein [Flavobacteriales bacterium]
NAAVHLGNGNINATILNLPIDDPRRNRTITVRPFELSTSGYYHVTWWLSAGGGVGYRYMRKTPPEARQAYNGFIYIAKLKIRFGKIVKSWFNEDVKNEY